MWHVVPYFTLILFSMQVLKTGCGAKSTTAPGLVAYLAAQNELIGGRALASFNFTAPPQPQQTRTATTPSIMKTPSGGHARKNATMIKIPPYENYTFSVTGVQVEGWRGFPGVSRAGGLMTS